MVLTCPNGCNPCQIIEENQEKGESICRCGAIVEKNKLVSEIHFSNQVAVGKFIHNNNQAGKFLEKNLISCRTWWFEFSRLQTLQSIRKGPRNRNQTWSQK